MGRPLKWSAEQKLPLVLSILRGEGSVAEIGRRHQVSDVTLANQRDRRLDPKSFFSAASAADGSMNSLWARVPRGNLRPRARRGPPSEKTPASGVPTLVTSPTAYTPGNRVSKVFGLTGIHPAQSTGGIAARATSAQSPAAVGI